MLKDMFKACGSAVYELGKSPIVFTHSYFLDCDLVENTQVCASYLNSFLTSFSQVNGGVVRRFQ